MENSAQMLSSLTSTNVKRESALAIIVSRVEIYRKCSKLLVLIEIGVVSLCVFNLYSAIWMTDFTQSLGTLFIVDLIMVCVDDCILKD